MTNIRAMELSSSQADLLLTLVESVQRYGTDAPMDNPSEAYRQGWKDGLEQLKKQLTQRA